nr:MAG TPA: hypothetical protein [Crassvirales sp.]
MVKLLILILLVGKTFDYQMMKKMNYMTLCLILMRME